VSTELARCLGPTDQRWLQSPAVVYGLDTHLRIAAVNSAWSDFATRNGGGAALAEGPLGRPALDQARGPIDSFYERAFTHVLDTGRPFEHVFECSSATLLRVCRMMVKRTDHGGGILVANTVTIERPHRSTSRVTRALDPRLHLETDGGWTECGGCRRVRRRDDESRWDWVPELLGRDLGGTQFAICPSCAELY
jgi:hypothetical protein